MEDKYICCICGKEHTGFGNNPDGAVDETKHTIKWSESDRCCDECNHKYVLPGRMYKFYRVIKNESLVRKPTDD
jgi:hypothetical protein